MRRHHLLGPSMDEIDKFQTIKLKISPLAKIARKGAVFRSMGVLLLFCSGCFRIFFLHNQIRCSVREPVQISEHSDVYMVKGAYSVFVNHSMVPNQQN